MAFEHVCSIINGKTYSIVFLHVGPAFKAHCAILIYTVIFCFFISSCYSVAKVGHEEEVMVFPFHKRQVKTISMKPPIFGECYMK